MLLPPLNADLTLDPKGRVMLPRVLQIALQAEGVDRLVAFANNGPARGLAFTRLSDYKALAHRHQSGSADPHTDVVDLADPRSRLFALAVASTAHTVSLDSAGRILVPGPLRAMFDLDRDLYLFTAGGWFELWDRDRWLKNGFPQATAAWDALFGFEAARPAGGQG